MRNRAGLLPVIVALACAILLSACGDSSKPITVALSQTSPQTLQSGQTLTLTATVTNDSKNQGITWSISPTSGCGTLSSSGGNATYTAPQSSSLTAACTATITATSASDTSKTSSVQITVNPISVSISGGSSQSAVAGGASLNLAATVTSDPASEGVTWSVSPATGCGAIATNGTSAKYTPPAAAANAACTATVTATSVSDTSKKSSVTITVTLPPIALTLSPNTAQSLDAGATLTLTTTITNDFGSQGVTWSVTPASCGSISANGTSATYTAPTALASACTAAVKVTAVADTTKNASVNVTVSPIAVTLSPTAAQTLDAGQTLSLTATISHDGKNSGLAWSISPATGCGTLSATTGTSITYTAPSPLAAQCAATITVASVTDPSKTLSVAVTVKPITINLSPSGPLNLGQAGTQVIQATVDYDLANQGVVWGLSPSPGCGTITHASYTSVTYEAPTNLTTSCTATVTAYSVSDDTKTKAITITVNPITISISPNTAQNLFAGGTLPVAATLSNDGASAGVSWTLSPLAGCGTLASNNGATNTYTAPTVLSSQCSVTVTVTSVTDNSKSAQVSITVSPAVVVALSPNTAQTVWAGQTLQITPTVSNDSANAGVTMSLTPATGCGALSANNANSGATVTYTAPASLSAQCTVTVTATSVTDTGKKATLNITVNPVISVTLSPNSPQNLNAGNTLQITPTLTGDVTNAGANLTLNPATGCGTLSASSAKSGTAVTYNAPTTLSSLCQVTVTATSVADNTKTATLNITVNPAIVVTLSPSSPQNLYTGGSLQITPTVSNDGSNGGVNFTLNPPSGCGSLSPMTGVSSGSPVTYTTPTSLSNSCSVTVTATSISDNTKSASLDITVYLQLSLPSPNPSSLGSANVGNSYNGAINASGGVPNYTWTVNSTTVTGGNSVSIGDGLSASSTGGNTLSISGTPTSQTQVSFTVSVKDSTNATAGPTIYTINVVNAPPLVFNAANLEIPQGMATMPYGMYLGNNDAIAGGTYPYTYSFTNLPSWTSADQEGNIEGTPTSAGSYTVNFKVTDASSQQVTGTFTIPVVALTSGANNSKLSGQYACQLAQYDDAPVMVGGNNFYLGGVLIALAVDGNGNITGGEADSNTPRSGYKTPAQNGSFSGTYAVGSDNRGYLKVVNSGETMYLALAAGSLDSSGKYSEVHLARMDDVGASPSGKHGGGVCYRQNTTGLNGKTLSGGYVFMQYGETSEGQQQSGVGSINISNGNATGVVDGVSGTDVGHGTFAMTVSSADSFGRVSMTCGSNCDSTVMYITNQTDGKALLMTASPHNVSNDLWIGEARAQNASHIAAAEPINGPFVFYMTGQAPASSGNFKSNVTHGNGSSSAKAFTFDAEFNNNNGTVKINESGVVGPTFTYTVDSATGRMTTNVDPADVFYLYDTNRAVFLFADGGSGGSPQNMLGWIEPQTNPTANGGKWVYSDLSASYVMTNMLNGNTDSDTEIDAMTLDSSGNISVFAGDRGGTNWTDWDRGLSMGGSGTATGLLQSDSTLDPSGTIGVFDVLLSEGGQQYLVSYCFAVSVDSATNSSAKGRMVCVDAMDKSPKVSLSQQ